jgi:protein-histidine pros-kinase
MLYYMVIQPVTVLSRLSDQVSLGQLDVPEFTVKRGDEIGVLSESFNRMRKSLVEAMRMLET